MKCPTCHREEKRSSEQNKRYWKLLSLLAQKPVQGEIYSSKLWHIYFKFKFLGADDIKLPNGKILTEPKGTSDLDKKQFNEYMLEVEVWCNEHNIYMDE